MAGCTNASIEGDKTQDSQGAYNYWILQLQLSLSQAPTSRVTIYLNTATKEIIIRSEQEISSIELVSSIGDRVWSKPGSGKQMQVKLYGLAANNYILLITGLEGFYNC